MKTNWPLKIDTLMETSYTIACANIVMAFQDLKLKMKAFSFRSFAHLLSKNLAWEDRNMKDNFLGSFDKSLGDFITKKKKKM